MSLSLILTDSEHVVVTQTEGETRQLWSSHVGCRGAVWGAGNAQGLAVLIGQVF